ncbi:ABC transporter substrate-binding protein [Undibacterium sp. Xuan67W]|uniref:ABC transporter substrate-binding protein n=1 Tax=Undibacterium sp. Xuan67W TaxID=3413057 RepID=UPI003BEF63F1
MFAAYKYGLACFCITSLLWGKNTEAAPTRLQKILEAKEIRVCIWPDYYGITFRNPKTRSLSGIDIDLSSELAKDLSVSLKYVDSSFPQLIDNLLENHCDIAMHAVGVTPVRAEKIAFTQAYLRSDIFAITTKSGTSIKNWDDIDKLGRVIVVQAGTLMEPVMQQTLKQAKLVSVKPPTTREQEVESGRADAFMTDYPYSRRMLETTDWARLVTPPQTFHLTDYAYAVAPGDKSLLDKVNVFIGQIKKDGRLLTIAKKYKLEPIVAKD